VYDDAYKEALNFATKRRSVYTSFDDEDVIAGQGTIALELMEQLPEIDAIVVPVGGGGLIAGIAYAVKTMRPSCRIYGVQAVGAASMRNSLCGESCMCLDRVSTFADGIAVKRPVT
jgi:threonine dehydratase